MVPADRRAATVGLIAERKRHVDDHLDGFVWFCEKYDHQLFRRDAFIDLLERDMPPVF